MASVPTTPLSVIAPISDGPIVPDETLGEHFAKILSMAPIAAPGTDQITLQPAGAPGGETGDPAKAESDENVVSLDLPVQPADILPLIEAQSAVPATVSAVSPASEQAKPAGEIKAAARATPTLPSLAATSNMVGSSAARQSAAVEAAEVSLDSVAMPAKTIREARQPAKQGPPSPDPAPTQIPVQAHRPAAPAPAQSAAEAATPPAPAAPVPTLPVPAALAGLFVQAEAIAADTAQPAAIPHPLEPEQMIERELDLAREGEWLDQLARDIARTGEGERSIRFRLHPQTLGHLRVEFAQGDHGTSIRLTAETEAARSILVDAQPRLIAEARAQGVRIAETHVDLGGSDDPAAGDPRRQEEDRQAASIRTAGHTDDSRKGSDDAPRARSDRYA